MSKAIIPVSRMNMMLNGIKQCTDVWAESILDCLDEVGGYDYDRKAFEKDLREAYIAVVKKHFKTK